MIEVVPSLDALYASHAGKVSDKWKIYLGEYGRLFEEFRQKPVRLLEIGIQNGGSLDIWSRYFSNWQVIVGCDSDRDCALLEYDDSRIRIVIGDAATERTRSRILQHSDAFDLVIDDGSHRTSDIIGAFAFYFPLLADGGVFAVEDLHCSYWKEFEGGLFYPYSSIAFFKRLADVLNHDHWGVDKSRADLFSGFSARYGHTLDDAALQQVHSVEFINSMCVVRKRSSECNRLGIRIIAGTLEAVADGHIRHHGTEALPSDQFHNEWSTREIPPEEEAAQREADFARQGALMGKLRLEIRDKDAHIGRLKSVVDEPARSRALDIGDPQKRPKSIERTSVDCDAEGVALSRAIGERDAALLHLTASLDRHAASLADVQRALGEREARVAELIAILGERDSRIAKLDHAAADGQQRAKHAEQVLAQRDELLNALMRTVAERDATIDRKQATCAQRDAENDELTSRLNVMSAKISDVSANMALRGAELEGVRRMTAMQEKHLGQLQQTIALRDVELGRRLVQQQEHERTIGELQQAAAQREAELAEIHRHSAAARSQVTEQLEHARTNAVQLEQALAECTTDNRELASRLKAANTRFDDASTSLALMDAELQGARRAVAMQEQHVDRLHRAIALRDGELDHQQTRQQDHERTIAELQQMIGRRDSRLDSVQRNLSIAQSQAADQLKLALVSVERLAQAEVLAGAQAAEIQALHRAATACEEQLLLTRQALMTIEAGRWTNRFKRKVNGFWNNR